MGLISSRLNLDGLNTGRRRSQQEEIIYTYSLNKNYFSNYFFMGGERFDVNDPDYLFGDNCDLNFLSCTRPYNLPYKRAQQDLLTNLNSKQKSINKVSSHVNRLSSPLSILTGRNIGGEARVVSNSRVSNSKHDIQTQTSSNSRSSVNKGSDPSKPLVMFINIRKETLRLVKSSTNYNLDVSSLVSANSSVKSGYISVKEGDLQSADDHSSNDDDDDDDDDDDFKDALNDPTNLSGLDNNEDDFEETQQQKSLLSENSPSSTNRVYNIEFNFDAEVDCFIRIFYFCTREVSSSGITYKPQHATYKSKVYYYKKGLNQKFDQQEHTFQPYLFDEDLLIYKPLDLEGNYNSGAVFPIVIHLVSLEGSDPKQSQSLVATIEKSQQDDSYSIKPLKQLIFIDGVQYILQDIYGIENKQLLSTHVKKLKKRTQTKTKTKTQNPPLQGSSNNLNLSDTASVISADLSLTRNSFECVICMSEERDTMLLPCRHLCLCSSCAQSLRYQANSCPICRCSFKAALNLRTIPQHPPSKSASSQNLNSNIATTNIDLE